MVTNREAFEQVIAFYKKRHRELQERHHDASIEVARLEGWLDECEKMIQELRSDRKLASEEGPYAEFTSTPSAIRAFLSHHSPSDLDTIIRGILEGGFKTESTDFRQVVRMALRRMGQRGQANQDGRGDWFLADVVVVDAEDITPSNLPRQVAPL